MQHDGRALFNAPGLDISTETYYKVIGDLSDESKVPLFVLHGGPGVGHECMLALSTLPDTVTVFYDQIGCGLSSLVLEKDGDEDFWTVELFCLELDNLIRHLGLRKRLIDIYGHSWGAAFGVVWAADSIRASNLRRLVLSSGCSSVAAQRPVLQAQRNHLPQDVQDVLKRCEKNHNTSSSEYEAACQVFYERHLSLARPYPHPEVLKGFICLSKSMHCYKIMFGENELSAVSGSLKNWTCVPLLPKVKASTLLINGSEDTMADPCVQELFDLIPKVKWVTLDQAGHISYINQQERHHQHLHNFLKS